MDVGRAEAGDEAVQCRWSTEQLTKMGMREFAAVLAAVRSERDAAGKALVERLRREDVSANTKSDLLLMSSGLETQELLRWCLDNVTLEAVPAHAGDPWLGFPASYVVGTRGRGALPLLAGVLRGQLSDVRIEALAQTLAGMVGAGQVRGLLDVAMTDRKTEEMERNAQRIVAAVAHPRHGK